MAKNSKREKILEALRLQLGSYAPSIKFVERVRPSKAKLQNLANSQLPFIAMVAGLPNPSVKWSGQEQGVPDQFTSDLTCEMYVYGLANVNPDTFVSNVADDIWFAIYAVPTLGFKYVLRQVIKPKIQVGHFDPYVVFKMDVVITYLHDKGGI